MPASGHVFPSLPLMRELVRRDIDVTYYASEEFGDAVERAGVQFCAYPTGSLSSHDIAEATTKGGALRVVGRVLTATETLLPALRDAMRAQPPDAVAFDSNALWGWMAAQSLGLPKISFMTTVQLGAGTVRSLRAGEVWQSAREILPQFRAVWGKRARVVRRFGKELYPPAPTLPMHGDITLFPIPRWMQDAVRKIDDPSCHIVGATIDPVARDRFADDGLAAHMAGPEPVVLVSLGTLHAGSGAFFRTCFEVLGELPAKVVLAIGSRVDVASLGAPPPNTLVRTRVPQLEVLGRASAFVTHGGMNSVLESLACSVPMVIVPQQVEQLTIGELIAGKGAGRVLRHHLSGRPVPPTDLRAAVEGALRDPAQRTAAKALATTVGEDGGAGAGADAIVRFLNRRG